MASPRFIRADDICLNVPLSTGKRARLDKISVVRDFYARDRERQLRPLIRGMSFHFQAGERVGLLGQNGAGKTTLLRLLSGVLTPSSGRLEVVGIVQSLLSVSMGLEPQASGYENIYLRGYASSLTTDQIKESIPEIVRFADLESVIHDPVRTYSAGMRLRLAFAVATSVKPEILLLDEWISAGDRFFVERSRERLMSHIDASEILLFASHDVTLLQKLCTRALVLRHGQIIFDGDVEDAVAFYGSEEYQQS